MELIDSDKVIIKILEILKKWMFYLYLIYYEDEFKISAEDVHANMHNLIEITLLKEWILSNFLFKLLNCVLLHKYPEITAI